MVSATEDAVQELEAMMDEGVHLALDADEGSGYTLRVRADEGCEDCLVPDDVLRQITADALERRGLAVDEVAVVHE